MNFQVSNGYHIWQGIFLVTFSRRLKEFRSEQSSGMILVAGFPELVVYTNTYFKVTFKRQLKDDIVWFADVLTKCLKLPLHYLLLFWHGRARKCLLW